MEPRGGGGRDQFIFKFLPHPGPYFQLPEKPRGEDSPAWTRVWLGSPKFALAADFGARRLASPTNF